MDVSFADRWELFKWPILAALIAGAVCPVVGCFLLLRRTSFYGITLPLFATTGVVCGFWVLPWWIEHVGLGGLDLVAAISDSHAAMNYHFAWAALFTFGGLATFVWLGRRGGTEVGRLAAAFAMANAATILIGRLSPLGKGFVDQLLQGEILGVGRHEFETVAVVLGTITLVLWIFHRDLLMVSYDRESALVLKKPVLAYEFLLIVITGLTVSIGTMTVGPTLLFGLLVIPPLAARRFARSMASLYTLSASIGIAAVVIGIEASFDLDLPLGAAIVGVAALCFLPGLLRPARA